MNRDLKADADAIYDERIAIMMEGNNLSHEAHVPGWIRAIARKQADDHMNKGNDDATH